MARPGTTDYARSGRGGDSPASPAAGTLAPMDPQDALELARSSGLVLPSPAWIFGCILFSLVGLAAWRWGKVVQRPRIRWLGVGLMFYSYATGPTWLLYGVGIALCGALWWNRPGAD